jgi:hypothetical protein
MSDFQPKPQWWQASDGKWYPPDTHPDAGPLLPSPTLPPPSLPIYTLPPATQHVGAPVMKSKNPKKPVWRRWWAISLATVTALFVLIGAFAPTPEGEADASVTVTPATYEASATTENANTEATSTTIATIAPASTAPASAVVLESRERLAALTVADPDPARSPYDRDAYQPGGWADFNGDCITTRHDVLIRDSQIPVTFDTTGCRVETGQWIDAFTADLLETADEATIDHHVPLAEAHRAGGWRWDNDTKVRFANDETMGALQVAGGAVNQSKADKTPDKWLPPVDAVHCSYAINWVSVKTRWNLTATAAEVDALESAIGTCTPATTPASLLVENVVVVTTLPPVPTTTAAPVAGPGPGQVVLVSCNARSEKVVISNPGGSAADLAGFVLHDEGRKHETTLGQWGTLAAGTNLTVVSGEEAVEGQGQVVWKRQNVWNNDGDIANLIAPDGTVQTVRC